MRDDLDDLKPEERLRQVARLLARAIFRLQKRRLSNPDNSSEIPPDRLEPVPKDC